jgi:hypothetical protein
VACQTAKLESAGHNAQGRLPLDESVLRGPLHTKLRSRIALAASILIVATLFVTEFAIRRRRPDLIVTLQVDRAADSNRTRLAAGASNFPACPPAGLPPLQSSLQKTGHHKVTLSWNASAPSGAFESKTVGYCLYRSKTPKAAKQNPTCGSCERINAKPIAGTGCVDDLVEDGADYYYVVTAINASGKISSSSNETPARIPPGEKPASSVPPASYPVCRGLAAQQ